MDLLIEVGKALAGRHWWGSWGWRLHELHRTPPAGLWQDRYGPNRVGPFGLLQLAADMVKMFFSGGLAPFADRRIFVLAPSSPSPPLHPGVCGGAHHPTWGVADLNIGLLFFFRAMAGLAVYAVLFAGWSSNNKYSLLGSLRASAQTLSYEVSWPSLMGIVIQTGSFNLRHRRGPGRYVERDPQIRLRHLPVCRGRRHPPPPV